MQPALAADGGNGPLASVQWLEKNLKRDDVLLIDASPGKMYSAGHIPGAVNVDLFSFGGREGRSRSVRVEHALDFLRVAGPEKG